MRKFKFGDKVSLLSEGLSVRKGATGIVLGYEDGTDVDGSDIKYVTIKWDRNKLDHGQQDGGYYQHEFKLIKEKEMGETIITKENLDKAYKEGSPEVKSVLKSLFPDVLKEKFNLIAPCMVKARIHEHGDGAKFDVHFHEQTSDAEIGWIYGNGELGTSHPSEYKLEKIEQGGKIFIKLFKKESL